MKSGGFTHLINLPVKGHHNAVRGAQSAYLVRTQIHTEVPVDLHYGYKGAPGVWTYLYTIYRRWFVYNYTILWYTHKDWLTHSQQSLVFNEFCPKNEGFGGSIEMWWVSAGDHYQQLLYILVVAASSICPCHLFMFIFFIIIIFFFCALHMHS